MHHFTAMFQPEDAIAFEKAAVRMDIEWSFDHMHEDWYVYTVKVMSIQTALNVGRMMEKMIDIRDLQSQLSNLSADYACL